MKFASAAQIIIMVVVVTVGCFTFDYYNNPQLWHHGIRVAPSEEKGVRLTLWINHLCCSACLDDVRRALATLPGIYPENTAGPKNFRTREQADKQTTSLPEYGNSVELKIADLDQIDFVALDRLLRDKGLVAGRMDLGGVEHFRLEAEVSHLCCGMCDRGAHERMQFLKARAQGGQLKWLDSVTVDRGSKRVVAYARFLQPGKTVDVTEFLGALNDIGFAPRSLQVLLHEHMNVPLKSAANQVSTPPILAP